MTYFFTLPPVHLSAFLKAAYMLWASYLLLLFRCWYPHSQVGTSFSSEPPDFFKSQANMKAAARIASTTSGTATDDTIPPRPGTLTGTSFICFLTFHSTPEDANVIPKNFTYDARVTALVNSATMPKMTRNITWLPASKFEEMIVHLLAKPLKAGMPAIDSDAMPETTAVTGMGLTS